MELVMDMETRSHVNLKDRGMYVYAEHESTDIMCIAVKEDDGEVRLWVPTAFSHLGEGDLTSSELSDMIIRASHIWAHNANFERVLWDHIMVKRLGFPRVPVNRWRCTAAKASAMALPRALHYVCEALDLTEKKDNAGYRVMMKMCKPDNKGKWRENRKDFEVLCKYCVQDVETEYELNQTLVDLPDKEQKVWELDQLINDRGIMVDIEAIDNLIYKVQAREDQLMLEIQELTGGAIKSTRQRDVTLAWLKAQGLGLDDLTKDTVTKALAREDISPKARRLLEIRQSLARSSVSKLDAMKRRACRDHRIRGSFLYHGASTGRWSGQGIQPQNYLRDSHGSDDIKQILQMGVDELEKIYGCTFKQASKCLRGMIMASPGKKLFSADYTSIEARVLAWLAKETEVIEAFNRGLDPYKVAAMPVYRKEYDKITKAERFVGKTIVLACGYQGWVGAFRAMADETVNKLSDEAISQIIGQWREARSGTVMFWRGVERAALQAIKTGDTYSYNGIKYAVRGRFLHCQLPSGRLLSYCDPGYETMETKYGQEKEVITFMGVNSMTKKWTRLSTYGGKLTENIVQAVARDILAEAMLTLDMMGYDIIMHVHDEIVIEGDNDKLSNIEELMCLLPKWAKGCPIGAEGWVGKRYRKG